MQRLMLHRQSCLYTPQESVPTGHLAQSPIGARIPPTPPMWRKGVTHHAEEVHVLFGKPESINDDNELRRIGTSA